MLGIYCRISGDKQGKTDYSIETQQKTGIELANSHNFEYQLYIDQGKSGTKFSGELEQLFNDLKEGKLHSIYAYDQSRFERNLDIWTALVANCKLYNVDIYLGNKKQDLEDDNSLFFSNLMSIVNNHYTRVSSSKLRKTYRDKIIKGKTHGRLPYGISRNANNEYIINEDELPTVKEIFRLAKIGYGTLKIAKILNQKGFNNRKNTVWQNSTVSGILKNKIYTGIKESYSNADSKIELISYELPFKIIEPHIFNEINSRLASSKRTKKSKYLYLLNELIICPSCGNFVTGRYRERDRSYKCIHFHSHLDKLQCKDAFGVSLPKLDTFILHLLFKTELLNFTVVESLKSNKELSSLIKELEFKSKELNLNNKKLNKYYNLFEDVENDGLDNNSIKNQIKSLIKIENELKNEIEELKFQIKRLENNSQLKTINDATEYFKSNYEFSKLQEFVHSIVESIKIHRSRDKKDYLIMVKLYSFDIELAYKTDKNLMSFYMLPFKDQHRKREFEDLFKHSFDIYFKEKLNKTLLQNYKSGENINDVNLVISDEAKVNYDDGTDYIDDMNMLMDILKEEYIDIIYNDLSVHLKKDELIHFNDPTYKKPIEI